VTDTRFQTGEDFASDMDRRDPLAHFCDRFHFPKTKTGDHCIYLCGHSLGLQPKTATSLVEQELHAWAQLGVEGHFHAANPWMPYHRQLTLQTAALVGGEPIEVVVMNSLTVNLHLMMASFYRQPHSATKFWPSGAPSLRSICGPIANSFHGFDPASSLLELTPRDGELCLRDEDIESLIDCEGDAIALILLAA